MLERELGQISVDAIAERAETGKATIYRWWPSKELLFLDALRSEWETAPQPPDTGTLGGDLRALVIPWTGELVRKPYGRVLASLIARAQADEEFGREYRAHFVGARREHGRAVFQRAIERGEISADTDIDVALDLLYGPVYHRLLHRHAPLTKSFAGAIVDYVLAAVSALSGGTE